MALEIAGSFLGPAIEVVKWVAAPILLQFNYLCCFGRNINSLKDEAKNLDDEARGLQMKVGAARNNAQVILPQVETWLSNSDDINEEMNRIVGEAPNVESGCLNLRERFSLSKKAKKTSKAMKELLEKCKFGDDISHPPPIAATMPVPLGSMTYEFESRRQIEEEIMTIFENKKVNKIGICGMGGVGKTTMAQKIMNGALKEGLFDEVVMVVVSQPVDKLNIQLQIAEPLGLKLEEKTLISRANKLRERLMKTKRVLLVLDDVWGSLDLEELGMPCEEGFKGCIILLTSRNMDVLKAMNVKKVCEMKNLNVEEAWIVFREKAGTCVDDIIVNPIAKDVMKECKGLPIALATAGVALKDVHGISIWEDALRQLRKSNPSDIPNIIKEVYNPLKVSYDRLDSKNAKSTFLLCCLFAEDADIPLEHLTYFAMGLHLFEDIWALEEVRGRIRTLIEKLKTRCLLLDGSDEDHVRMHDVVRDVSIFIASQEKLVKGSDCTWISSFVDGRARESGFPNAKLLLMDNNIEQEIEINDSLIGGSKELNVLFIKYSLLKSLPHTTQLLKSLTTLVLYHCESLESISVAGQFENLEILICDRCGSIKELPVQVRGLRRLRLLEISKCFRLKRVAAGVISSLVGLEELKIVESFGKWEAGEVEGKNAGLRELESLTNLRWLEIQVLDSKLAAQPLRLSPKLVKFNLQFGADIGSKPPKKIYRRRMSLDFPVQNKFRGDLSTNVLLTSTEYLVAKGHSADVKWNLAIPQNIRWLELWGLRNMKNITSSAAAPAAFPLLEFLSLKHLDNLEEIWDGPIPSNSFNNLKKLKLVSLPALKQLGKTPYHNSVVPLFTNLSSLHISHCNGLRNLFSSETAKDCLLRLERISISFCEAMEQLVLVQNEQDKQESGLTIFPKLKSLHLQNLPKLTSICKRIESIEFPLLVELQIDFCWNLKCVVVSSDDDNNAEEEEEHYRDDDSSHLFCQPKVSFSYLKNLSMRTSQNKNVWCDQVSIGFFTGLRQLELKFYSKITSLFSSSTAQNLVNLQKLVIFECQEMVRVIEEDEEDLLTTEHSPRRLLLFPSLQDLRLSFLPKLESFCEWRSCALELPSLRKLSIAYCDEMRSFSAGSLITPALQIITINDRDLESAAKDLNAALHQLFEQAKVAI